MPVRLGRFEMPKALVKDEATATETYAKFIAEPFEMGYGHTIGNSLRRVLLSSLEGAAVTTVRIAGAQHEFTTLPGVVEDVTDIVLNLKKVKLKPRIQVEAKPSLRILKRLKLRRLKIKKRGKMQKKEMKMKAQVMRKRSRKHLA